MTQVVFKRAANLAEMKAQAIEIANSHDGKVWAEAGIYTDDNGTTHRPQVVLCTGDWQEVAVLRWNAFTQEEGVNHMGKRQRVEARESAERFQDIIQDVITRHYESTSPVEVVNEYTAIKVAESVADQSGEITHADLFVLLNQNRIHSFGDMAHINEMIDNTRIESGHLTVIYIKNVPVSGDHDKDEMNSLKDSLANRLDNNVMTGRKFTRSLWTDRQIDSEFLSVDQFAKMVAATQEAPQGWESVEGGAKLTWGESESITVSPEFERDAYNHHVTTRLFDQLATRSHMLTRDQSSNHWKAITDMLWTLHASTIETRKMNDFATITRASHGPMVEAQIRTCTDTLAALLATWHAMPEA